jgi:Mycothiol maleylpyruvate isomerase N-terminal domain
MTTTPISDLDMLAGLQSTFLTSIPEVDPGAPAPACGRWRVRNLVIHLSRIHHWAADLYGDCATELLETLRSLDPAAPA